MMKPRHLVAVVGPTGSGKSELSLYLAERFDGEVVSCDALQVYRGLDIGTAKCPPNDRRGIPHHLMDLIDPDEEFSAADFVGRAVPVIRDICSRGRLALLVGGTGLYLRALRFGLFEGPGRSPELRARLKRVVDRRGGERLHRMLQRLDPESAERVHPNDRVRLVRALEVSIAAGRPMSDLMRERVAPLPGFRHILIGLRPPRESWQERISARVQRMFEEGLVAEVRGLLEHHSLDCPAFKAIGYREAALVVVGELDEARARELVLTASLRYAKRQMTWFRKEEDVIWFDGRGTEPGVKAAVADRVRSEIDDSSGGPASGTSGGRKWTALTHRRPDSIGETLHAETTP